MQRISATHGSATSPCRLPEGGEGRSRVRRAYGGPSSPIYVYPRILDICWTQDWAKDSKRLRLLASPTGRQPMNNFKALDLQTGPKRTNTINRLRAVLQTGQAAAGLEHVWCIQR